MLPLNPLPPQTDGERAFFSELVRWDTGNAVRGAVVASIPFADGPLQRRLSDAILIVPEGIAVVRVAEVERQTGVVTASPEGPWTIGPPGTGGAVLQLSGGGSTPLDGLMRAGMETAVRLRRAGLEPGRIARLTVLVGDISGLLPTDGDLGEGDQVALLDTRSLLLGIARASRYAGVDNPRLWTTADVRAALEALGLQGRGPSVEELNGEGFPYSPYVLRRPQLLTPATMNAGSGSPAPVEAAQPPAAPPAAAPPPAAPPGPPAGPTPESIAQAVAASVAAAHAAGAVEVPQQGSTGTSPVPAGSRQAPAPTGTTPPARDTVAIDGPEPAGSTDTADAGIGGLFANAAPETPVAAQPPRTAVLPAQTLATPQPPAGPPVPPLSLAHQQAAQAAQPAPPPTFWNPPGVPADEEQPPRRSRRLLVLLAVLVLVVGLGVGAYAATRGGDDADGGGSGEAVPTAGSDSGPAVGSVQEIDGVPYTVEAATIDDTCIGHAYGDTQAFFGAQDCTGLARALYSTEVDGRAVVVSVVRVRMADTATARELRALTDTNGSGNVSDLLREGVTYEGAPAKLSNAEYASAVSGPTVTVVESAWVDPAAGGSSAEIDLIASNGLQLATPSLD